MMSCYLFFTFWQGSLTDYEKTGVLGGSALLLGFFCMFWVFLTPST